MRSVNLESTAKSLVNNGRGIWAAEDPPTATGHLNTLNHLGGPKPWKLNFSFGRALPDEALQAWQGKAENFNAGQSAFFQRAMCVSAAALGKYTQAAEREVAA